jgi:hypothetical protein
MRAGLARWLTLCVGVMVLGAQAVSAQDPDLAVGIRHVDEGDFEAALVPLGRAVRTLSGDSSRSKELAEAHLYLGVAYVMLDQEKAGRASFREALTLQKDLRLSPEEFPRKVLRAFAASLQDAQAEGPAPTAPVAQAETSKPAAPAASEPSAESPPWLREAIDPSYEINDGALRMATYVLGEPTPGRALVTIAVDIDARKLAFVEKDGRLQDVLQFHLGVVNRETGESWHYSQAIDMKLLPQTRARGWIPFLRNFQLPSGSYLAVLVVREGNSSSVGNASCPFDVPPLSGFRVSSPVISDSLTPAGIGTPPQAVLLAHRELPRSDMLYVQTEVFGATPDKDSGLPRVSQGVTVRRRDGRELRRLEPTRITPTADGRVTRLVGMDLDLEQGVYEVLLTFRDELSGEVEELSEYFAVVGTTVSGAR